MSVIHLHSDVRPQTVSIIADIQCIWFYRIPAFSLCVTWSVMKLIELNDFLNDLLFLNEGQFEEEKETNSVAEFITFLYL